ncbi:MAG: hypothetical protein GXO89_17510 [Chlorobi bacterium]|nr:hypothetical protein [Chlorobiota bacterium]
MKTKNYLLTLITALFILPAITFAQGVAINTDDSEADPSAMLEIKSTSKGLLIPRMPQTEIENILNPANGLIVFSTTEDKFFTFIASEIAWKEIAYGTSTIVPFGDGSIGTGGSCDNTGVFGDYKTGQVLSATEFVTIEVNVTAIGAYSITTNTVNGYSFSANGVYSSTGVQTVDLAGSGTPVAYQIDNFTVTASNSGGTCSFDVLINVTCGGTLTDSRDAQNYNTVQIGTQCWMAENLNIGTMVNGSSNQTDNSTIEKYCYSDNSSNCDTYGGLYQWNEMMEYNTIPGIQGICPTGWHLPTDAEWCTLENEVDAGTVDCNATDWRGTDAGGNLKETGFTHWSSPNTGATNSSGFTALGTGYRGYGNFLHINVDEFFWTSNENGSNAWFRLLGETQSQIARDVLDKSTYGFSARCLQGEPTNQPPSQPSNPSPADASTDQPVNTTLSWTCSDPESDPLTYDVYFGETNPPALVSSGQLVTTYDPGTLNYSNTYYWKITAYDDQTNSTEGSVWGFTSEAPLICGNTFIDTRNSQSYSTVQIGTQCWMAENLNIGTMINGSGNQTNNSTIEKYCYGDNASNCDTYGGLYQWDEMMEYTTAEGTQGICPIGWHLPSDAEWCTLENVVDAGSIWCPGFGLRGTDVGGKLKETGTTYWLIPNTGATNSSGFTALPGGYAYGGSYNAISSNGYWWSSAQFSSTNAVNRSLLYNDGTVGRFSNDKIAGFSVRCIQN